MANIGFNIDKETKTKYKIYCASNGTDMSEDLIKYINSKIK